MADGKDAPDDFRLHGELSRELAKIAHRHGHLTIRDLLMVLGDVAGTVLGGAPAAEILTGRQVVIDALDRGTTRTLLTKEKGP